MFHEEFDRVSGRVADETLVDAQARTYVHGRILVIMERTDAHIVLTLLAQGDKIAHHLLNTDGGHHTVYGLLLDHGGKNTILNGYWLLVIGY